MCRYIWILVPPVNIEYTTSCKFYTGVGKKIKIKITFLYILLAAEERCYQHPQPAREFLLWVPYIWGSISLCSLPDILKSTQWQRNCE